MLENLRDIHHNIIKQMPPETRFRSSDALIIQQHRDFLHSLTPIIVEEFYTTLYNHSTTRAIFKQGERPAREDTLKTWWQRVVDGPIDDAFWDWMVFVGLVHIARRVKNPMLLSAWGQILTIVMREAPQQLEYDAAVVLQAALIRFGQTFTSLIADSYLQGIINSTSGGISMLENLASQEMNDLLEEFRQTRQY